MKVVLGDLLQMAHRGEFDAIVHGCNCFHTMGGGIAYQIREKYPQAAEADRQTVHGDINKLGTYSSAYADTVIPFQKFMIINAYTQYGFTGMGGRSGDVFEYEAFEKLLKELALTFTKSAKIGFPLIGCGLAGGDRPRIMRLIEDYLPNATVVEWKMIND